MYSDKKKVLGVLDLEQLGSALRIRWLWLEKTDPSKPWSGLTFQVPQIARSLFDAAVITAIGDGNSCKILD
jgi:hypothetical protein